MNLISKLRAVSNPPLAHIVELTDRFAGLLGGPAVDMPAVAGLLDALEHPVRLAAVRSLGRKQLAHLYEAAKGYRTVTLADLVPKTQPTRTEVRHYGKNSLPAFSIFEKRFLRPAEDAEELWGYNFQRLAPITGPGYFIARDNPERGEVDIDYHQVPPERPDGWPQLADNDRGLGRLVYGQMVDHLRGITAEVSIGRAWKKGKIQPAWFILCRG
jgi:hypothetical protein